VDRQAEDRCHRLGQEKKVTVYKLITKGSCEEHIFSLAEEKKQLNDLMLEEGNFDKKKVEKEMEKVLGEVFEEEEEISV